MKDEKIFADGFSFKRNENAPDFVVGRLSMKVDEAITFLKKYDKNGWVNCDIKTARSGNTYVELDTYDPSQKKEKAEAEAPVKTKTKEELPF